MSSVLSNEEYAELVKSGKLEYITPLWEQMYKLLYGYADKYYNKYNLRFIGCGITLEDLQQECFFILLEMVRAYDPTKQYKLTTYTKYQFKHRINRLLRIGDNLAENPLNSCYSLSEPVTGAEDEDITLEDMQKDEAAELAYQDIDDNIYQHQLRMALNNAMTAVLTPEQTRAIVERFYNNKTLKETGAAMGVTAERARTYESNGLKNLRRYSTATKRLDSFREHIITEHAYKHTGLNSFKYSFTSSVERTYEALERMTGI